MKKSIRRTLYSPRWQWLNRLIGPWILSGDGTNQWLRVVMNQETTRLVDALDPGRLKVLEISGTFWNRPGLFGEYRSVDFPEFDVCTQVLDETFDLIIAEQVFEHLLYPRRAALNVLRMLKPGGRFLVTTPFLVRVHPHPTDCTRWTASGLQHFLADCGFELDGMKTGSWGNRQCVLANLGARWQIYQQWRHSLENDPLLPIAVWALAARPEKCVLSGTVE